MREKRLIIEGSPCDANFYENGPQTVAKAQKIGRSFCPYKDKCDKGHNPYNGWQCLMAQAVDVAKFVINRGNTVETEVEGDFREFFMESNPPKGFLWSPDRKEFIFIKDKEEALGKVKEFATLVIHGRRDEKLRRATAPQRVGSSFEDVVAHATTSDGAINLSKIDELEGRFGTNGGRGCDVLSGPCSCGAWH